MVTTYYPGVVDASSAMNIEVDAGRVTGGIEIRVQNPPTYHIRGRVSGPRVIGVTLRRQDGLTPSDDRTVSPGTGGSFDISGVQPATYVIEGTNVQYSARAVVTVSNADIDNLAIEAAPCPKIRGTITLDGTPFTQRGLGLRLSEVDAPISFGAGDDGNGGFTVACAPQGGYALSIPLKTGQYVRAVTLDGKDVTDSIDDLDLTSPGDKTLNIALASRAAEVRGTVRDRDGKPQPAVPVTLWKSNGGFDATVASNPDGTFEFTNLAPGNYRVAAWDGLRPQPPGWGVQTVSEFRDAFETEVTHIVLGEDEHASVDPAVISREAIRQAATRLRLNAITTDAAEEAEISAAVKSPETLAGYVKSHKKVDWEALQKALGLKEGQFWFAPCAANYLAGEAPCTALIETVSNPKQAIVTIRGGELSHAIEHLRYLQEPGGGWKFAGEINAVGHYQAGAHRLTQIGSSPFLIVSTDHSQNGMATQQTLEEWYDLTLPDLERVFTFTPDGAQGRYGLGVGREIKATCKASEANGVERIEMTLAIDYDGPGLNLPATYTGVYERRPGEEKFALRRATIPVQDFKELADPFSDLSNEKLLQYALPGLEKIASGSDADAKKWLKSVLEYAQDTPEKRALLDLLGKH